VSFAARPYVSEEPSQTIGTLAGDFNGDAKPDVVEVYADHAIAFFGGIGDGRLRAPIRTDIGAITTDIPASAVTADFNGDGHLDVAICYQFSAVYGVPASLLTVHFGDGTGHFSQGVPLTTGEDPQSFAVGDFNVDGSQDLVVASNGLWFHFGNGDGTFQSAVYKNVDPYAPSVIIAGNVNNYGGDDLVTVAGPGRDVVVWNEAGLNGESPQVIPNAAGLAYSHLALGDLNGDGYPDLVVGSWNVGLGGAFYGQLSTFLGSGSGSFTLKFSAPSLGYGVALADFNTDGKLDIVTGAKNTTVVLLGDGSGGVSAWYDFLPLTRYFVVEDFNSDGRPDLAMGQDFTLLINTSPRGCVDTLALGYAKDVLTLGFSIKTAIPVVWNVWIGWQNSFVPLWSVEIPAVPTAVSFALPIPGVPPMGNIAVLTTMSSATYGLMCGDWKMVDTGGVGPTLSSSRR